MSVSAAKAKLAQAIRDIRVAWDMARPLWRDQVAQDFERQVLYELERDIRTAQGAMEQLGDVLGQAKRDCG